MTESDTNPLETLCTQLLSRPSESREQRFIVAIAGPPASGKSTLAEQLVTRLNEASKGSAALLPMDGFHLDNRVLEARGLLARKGAPETFDVEGFGALVSRLRERAKEIIHPVFDRSRELAIAGAGVIAPDVEIVVVEGNYLLLRQEPWASIRAHYDWTVFISPTLEVLEQRLLQRWRDHGFDDAAARAKAQGNDLPNARLVLEWSVAADIRFD